MLRVLSHPLALLIFTLMVGLFSFSLYSNVRKTRISTEQVGVLEQEITQIASDVSTLEQQVQKAQSPETKEQLIRDQLLMQKEGEIVVQLPDLPEGQYLRLTPKPSAKPLAAWKELLF